MKSDLNIDDYELLKGEVELMSKIEHPNVIHCSTLGQGMYAKTSGKQKQVNCV